MIKINYKNILIILAFTLITAATVNYFSEYGIPLIRTNSYLPIEKSKLKTGNSINVQKAYELMDNKNVKFVDARDKLLYDDEHIQGSLNISVMEFDPESPILEKINKKDSVIIYCDDEICGLSKKLLEKLDKLGFKNLFVLEGGWELWKNIGLPTEK